MPAPPPPKNMRRKLAENLKRVREQIGAACERSGRRPEDVHLVAVTKAVGVDVIRAVIDTGILDLGENRAQELVKRASMIKEHLSRRRAMDPAMRTPRPCWHMIGHLQRNKVRPLLPWIHTIHSVDSLRLAEEISNEAVRLGKTISIMLEVNVSGEKTKMGIAVGAAPHLAEHIAGMPGVCTVGLMTMAPLTDDQAEIRSCFRRLREVFEDMHTDGVVGPEFKELSMGMSNDFEIAIEEGATYIRVGGALFDAVHTDTIA